MLAAAEARTSEFSVLLRIRFELVQTLIILCSGLRSRRFNEPSLARA